MAMRRKMFIFLLICGAIPIVISIGMLVAARFNPGVDRFLSAKMSAWIKVGIGPIKMVAA